ncbi:unnamed protein product [Arabidopsis arenosa]|uniref:VPS9 domain-containing protein n=1 Tax=Arabidopsis arenosa TaxID=38785 RepID=A0A8S1ZK23_ARAAE|nr:unnamed protein product [Arabidopsis arenosa]
MMMVNCCLQNELPKINSFKSPRDKLLCISSCCTLISNLMLDTSKSNAIFWQEQISACLSSYMLPSRQILCTLLSHLKFLQGRPKLSMRINLVSDKSFKKVCSAE